MVRFGQRSVDFLVRRPVLSLSSLALVCLALVIWQGVRITGDAHRHAAVAAARDQARTFNALAKLLHQQRLADRNPESAVARPSSAAPTALHLLAGLARRLNKKTSPDERPTTRIVSTHGGLGVPTVQGHFELEAAQRFLYGQRSPHVRVVTARYGRAVQFAMPIDTAANLARPIRPAVAGTERPLVMQIITAPLPSWVDGLAHTFNWTLLLLVGGVSVGFCLVVFLLRRLNSLLTEGKELAYMAVQHNEELQSAVNGAHHANQAKSDFLAKMSHELRTPLNAIIGFSDIIRSPYGDRMAPEKRREYAHDIFASGSHLLSVINEILDISRIEAGRFELEEERFALTELVESAVRIVRDQADTASLHLDVRVANNAPDIWADLRALRQVLINLLANALKFTDPGGVVSLLGTFDANGQLLIAVSDSGIGISPEDIDKVLQPFEQVESAMSRKNYGTGLGLPIAKNIIEQHGGQLHLESALHQGTKVTLVLPAERIYWPQHQASGQAAVPNQQGPAPLLDAETGQPLAYAQS